ncbi:MAG: RluA family pseudouridine synthase [Thermodesulfobacteriota bacterium]
MELPSTLIIDKIPDEFIGKRFDSYLPMVLKNYSRSQIKKYIENEYILIDKKPFKPSRIISGGEKIFVNIPPSLPADIAAEDIELEVIYEDKDIIVVNKPAGLTVHPGAGVKNGTLVNALLFKVADLSGIGGEIRPGIVHRLDKGSSGLIVAAKNDYSHRSLSDQFKNRTVKKEYVAVVVGEMKKSSGIFDKPITRDPNNRVKMTTKLLDGRASLTNWEVIKRYRGYTFVKAEPKSGRTHQIRVHFAEGGFPLLGDNVYGNNRSKHFGETNLKNLISRQALHAVKLSFRHPFTQELLQFEAPIPGDIKSVLEFLEEKS